MAHKGGSAPFLALSQNIAVGDYTEAYTSTFTVTEYIFGPSTMELDCSTFGVPSVRRFFMLSCTYNFLSNFADWLHAPELGYHLQEQFGNCRYMK